MQATKVLKSRPVEAPSQTLERPKPVEAPSQTLEKPKPVEAPSQTLEKPKPVKVRTVTGARCQLAVPAVRNSRASSCPRCPPRDRSERRTGAEGPVFRTSCERRTRSSSTARKTTTTTTTTRTNLDTRRASPAGKHGAGNPKCREMTPSPGQRDQQGVRSETRSQSLKAFTVIPPNPQKRREIQRKAEAELAALEELRLSRATAFVSIDPASVGGCMSLEEVRLKQQQEMMRAKRRPNVKKQVVEKTSVLNG